MADSPSDDESVEHRHVEADEVDSQEESDDESSDASDGGGLLDTMAAEGSDEESSDASSEGDGDGSQISTSDLFPQFARLPIELRQRIWELFCPELQARQRVLSFTMTYGTARYQNPSWPADAKVWTVHDGLALEDQTKTIRTVFAVHQESRAMALRAYPHSLSMDAGSGDAIVAFNGDSDVVFLNGPTGPGFHVFQLSGFAEVIKHVALDSWEALDDVAGSTFCPFIEKFAKLEALYIAQPSRHTKASRMAWCVSDHINRYEAETFEKEPGYGEDLRFLYCWPDLRNHPDYAKFEIPRGPLDLLPEPIDESLRQKGAKAWPMIVFEFERGAAQFASLRDLVALGPIAADDSAWDDDDDDESSANDEANEEDESGTDLDQYESDGIDDAEIVETYDSSDGEGISLGGGSMAPPRPDVDAASDDGSGAQFSSPEPEPEPEQPELAPLPRGRKRRVVSDSDDESDDDDVQPSFKRARVEPIVLSDSENESEPVQSRDRSQTQRATHVVISDDEDEDEDASERGGSVKHGADVNAEESGASSDEESDGSEDGDDVSEEEEEPPTRMSLAERLRLTREENPVGDSGDEGDNSDEDDRSSRTADVESEDDDEDLGNPFMLNMADESDGEGEPGYYEEDD
ncbi:hypothetical protein FZEAL_756 [Fusarium zealandicum]|uniref:2EXR domain-containing protein n=1 Tax=Fusarium zealandicum TaxID=1053134 RepID=A0A8H4UU53_9HYPO|nr:hypothetical protein FZEAL_756 [Fusarium zealandicum]